MRYIAYKLYYDMYYVPSGPCLDCSTFVIHWCFMWAYCDISQ